MRNLNKNTPIGAKVSFNGDMYIVKDIYQITNEYMKKHNLSNKDRVTLKKIEGIGLDELDFALTE